MADIVAVYHVRADGHGYDRSTLARFNDLHP
jgi:hypothetical protein